MTTIKQQRSYTSECVVCARKVSQSGLKPSAATCWVFRHIRLSFGICRPLWQVTSPRSEVLLFSDISAGRRSCTQGWLILAGSDHCNRLISSPIHSVLEVNEELTITAHQQQGLMGGKTKKKLGASPSHILLNVKMVLMWFCLLPGEMFWSWTIVSTYQCWWSLVVDSQ